MIRTLIIDDEPINIINLQRLLQAYCPNVQVIKTATSADEGAASIREHQPDLVLLDIQMPGKSGLDMLRSLPAHGFELIMVTAYDHYGIQAVKFSAIDYLLKPVDTDELQAAIDKVAERLAQKQQHERLNNLLNMLHAPRQEEHRLALPSLKETRFVYTREIIRCESSNSYTTFHLDSGGKIVVAVSIYEYEEMLSPYGFIRCHQSHLVNRRYVKSLVKESGGYLLLTDGSQIPVSRQKKDAVKNALL
ncbi:LytTR family DNA-binding domain-containing protein [Chitinophaga horti]|uniref:LytTR family DNA-binding domain-containing protein n=1 Tax=Chitinophaga horti TaxID=2920382 RepID=A0ABY6J173_9BACT|nr:LytTR family DNA-binding domain-containing protein [Chitinophaga horti]UYQ92377.1 LytTR family DNA-binding domain-containing protein [Chitinophaga horti]